MKKICTGLIFSMMGGFFFDGSGETQHHFLSGG